MTSVGTVNPGLTALCVVLFVALVVTIVVLANKLARARGQLFTVTQAAARTEHQRDNARKATSAAEQQRDRLLAAVEAGMTAMREAIDTRDQLEIIARHTGELLALHDHVLPDGGAGQYAVPAADMPDDPYPIDDAAGRHAVRGYPVQRPEANR